MHKLNEIGWWAFVAGWAMLIIAPFSWLLYAIPLLIAIALGVVLMVRDRVASGVKLLLCVFAVPAITLLLLFLFRTDIFIERMPRRLARAVITRDGIERPTLLANIEIHGLRTTVDSDHMVCEGRVHNTGHHPVNWIRVRVLWYDGAGQILTTDVIRLIYADPLPPGQVRRFHLRQRRDPRVERADAYIMAADES